MDSPFIEHRQKRNKIERCFHGAGVDIPEQNEIATSGFSTRTFFYATTKVRTMEATRLTDGLAPHTPDNPSPTWMSLSPSPCLLRENIVEHFDHMMDFSEDITNHVPFLPYYFPEENCCHDFPEADMELCWAKPKVRGLERFRTAPRVSLKPRMSPGTSLSLLSIEPAPFIVAKTEVFSCEDAMPYLKVFREDFVESQNNAPGLTRCLAFQSNVGHHIPIETHSGSLSSNSNSFSLSLSNSSISRVTRPVACRISSKRSHEYFSKLCLSAERHEADFSFGSGNLNGK
jgi:hypothetical protein